MMLAGRAPMRRDAGRIRTLWAKTASGASVSNAASAAWSPARSLESSSIPARDTLACTASMQRVVAGAAVGQVVAVDHGDDDVVEAEALDGVGEALGLGRVGSGGRLERLDGTEPAAARAARRS